jgi:hypothetical protein
LYPTGEWSGWYTQLELVHAQECGARVDPQVACVWEGAEPVLAPWVRSIYKERERRGKKSSFGKWLKWYLNSLTGKLLQRPVRSRVHLWPEEGPQKGWEEISSSPQVFTSEEKGLSACMHVQWSAYLLAATRIKVNRQQLAGGRGGRDMVYTDTDSVLSEGPRKGQGTALGQWEHAGPFEGFEALAPKVYRYEGKHRAKGIPLPDEPGARDRVFDRLKAGRTVRWRGPGGWKSSLKASKGRDPFVARDYAKALKPIRGWIGGRLVDADGRHTHPPHVTAVDSADRT